MSCCGLCRLLQAGAMAALGRGLCVRVISQLQAGPVWQTIAMLPVALAQTSNPVYCRIVSEHAQCTNLARAYVCVQLSTVIDQANT
jgi:hypothetical protein